MNGAQFCELLQAPAEAPPGELLSAWERRRAEIAQALDRADQAKPVRLRLREELRRLDEGTEVAAQLRRAAEAERYIAEAEREAETAAPAASVLRLCVGKARPLVAALSDGGLQFAFERRLACLDEILAAPPAPPPPIPSAPPALAATVLELTPAPADGTVRSNLPTVRVRAGPAFRIGRAGTADWVARHWPDNDENRQRTSTISRIQLTFTLQNRQLFVQDGQPGEDGTSRPSRNGTWVDDRRIGVPVALNFRKERRIKVGQFGYEFTALQLPGTAPAAETPPQSSPGREGLGCLRVQSVADPLAPVGVWLLSEASLGSGEHAMVRLPAGLPAVAARFHFQEGRFWLQVPAEGKSVITLDGRRRLAGDCVALQAAQELRLGDHRYSVRIE